MHCKGYNYLPKYFTYFFFACSFLISIKHLLRQDQSIFPLTVVLWGQIEIFVTVHNPDAYCVHEKDRTDHLTLFLSNYCNFFPSLTNNKDKFGEKEGSGLTIHSFL